MQPHKKRNKPIKISPMRPKQKPPECNPDKKISKLSKHPSANKLNNKSKTKTKSKNKNKKSPQHRAIMQPISIFNPKSKSKSKSKQRRKIKRAQTSARGEGKNSSIEQNYRKSLMNTNNQIRWVVPDDQVLDCSFNAFWDFVNNDDFKDLNNLTMNFLHYVCKKRIIRDRDFNFLFEGMVRKFPDNEEQIQYMLVEVLKILDS